MNRYPDDNPKTVQGQAKPAFDAIPPSSLVPLGAAMQDGKRKYGLMNWREKPVTISTYYNAALRHLMSFWDGENVAQDSGVHHLGHVMACCAILYDAQRMGTLNDDRGIPGSFPDDVQKAYEAALKSMAPQIAREAPSAADVAATLQPPAPPPKAPTPVLNYLMGPRDAPPPEPSPAIKQAFGLGVAPEGRAPGPEMPAELRAFCDKREPEQIPDWPFDYRPRALAVPASRTYANADGKVNALPIKGDEILIYHDEYGWVWRVIREVSVTMMGRRYNVSTDGISVSILMVPEEHVMAVKTKEGMYIGSNNRTA
jgi:hypothetical protein